MKERFKFRIWNNVSNSYEPLSDKTVITMRGECATIKDYGLFHMDNGPWIIEQCTGLKDKSTNLIYANDLIKSPNNSNLLVVKQEENGLWQPYEYNSDGPLGNRELPLFDLVRLYGVEIVGNIHERKD